MWDQITKVVGEVASISIIVAAIGSLIGLAAKKSIEHWMQNLFDTKKKEFEHKLAKEMEELKIKIDTAIQGSLKLQEREFRIIPDALEKISEAFRHAQTFCFPFQECADVGTMNLSELDELLARTDLAETQKTKLRWLKGGERANCWLDVVWQRRSREAWNRYLIAINYLDVNGVFIPDELLQQFRNLLVIIRQACKDMHFAIEQNSKNEPQTQAAWSKLDKEAHPILMNLQKAVRARLL